jgi:hypothetical protein
MNFIFEINDFYLENIHFLETKKNIIMDGNFTKISYSDDCILLNGIYIHFPIEISKTQHLINKNNNYSTIEKCDVGKFENNSNKNMIYFDPNLLSNKELIKKIAKIEKNILEYYLFINMNNSQNNPYENIFSGLQNYQDSSLLYHQKYKTISILENRSKLLPTISNDTFFEISNNVKKMNQFIITDGKKIELSNKDIDIAYEKESSKMFLRKNKGEIKQINNKLETQLQNGVIKLFKPLKNSYSIQKSSNKIVDESLPIFIDTDSQEVVDTYLYQSKKQNSTFKETYHFLLKISGVWENNFQIGITYKFIEISGEPNMLSKYHFHR